MAKNDYKQVVGDVLADYNTEIMQILNSTKKKPAVHTDEEVRDRANDYFDACGMKGILPDLASLALALGISKYTLEGWARGYGCSASRREVIQWCYTVIEAAQLQASASGTFNPILFVFLAKSKYGYREDGTTPGLGGPAVIDSSSTPAEIADRYNTPLAIQLPSLAQHDDLIVDADTPADKAPVDIEHNNADTALDDGTHD